eukprot:TRINITY_DN1140_c0_g1_i1.p1 TRINITY_DN1140_c0_g1~~TRINITY_DN1140_c0_g1_i1.p1  ORF type:complete len:422 (+),score=139.31 TRINITY_DN1140_c0_g1_i1:110-1375(+)
MGKGFIDSSKASTYKLVHKSHEDPTYEDDKTAGTLMHVEKGSKRTKGYSENILREEMSYRYDMHNPDDTVEQGLFEDEVEEAFDQDWIRQMMEPGEEEEEEELDEYPRHENVDRDIDKEFAALMKSEYAAVDMDLEENDPRVEGLMSIDAYVPALQEFVAARKEGHFADGGKHEGEFMKNLKATGEEVFHEKEGGQFLTVLPSKKDVDFADDYEAGMEEAKKVVLERIQAEKKLRAEKGEEDEEEEVAYEYVRVKDTHEDKWDCQTVLTTLSTLENHPTIIAAEKGRIKINPRTGTLVRQNKLTTKNLNTLGSASALEALREGEAQQEGDSDESDAGSNVREGDEESDGEESLITVIDTTVKRNKNETADEKRERKKQLKAEKKEMRTAKKSLKTAYKAETLRQRWVDPAAKQQKAMLSLR